MRNSPRSSRRGFTLIELMIVVVIIGILAAIAIPKFTAVSRDAKESEAPGVLKQIYTLETRYYQKSDAYATSIAVLEGGPAVGQDAKYYDFGVTSHATGFCATAVPNTQGTSAGVASQSIDANGYLHRTGDCT
jgi:prepilin-type N-terminal cleavage/methylation domain-containing protein